MKKLLYIILIFNLQFVICNLYSQSIIWQALYNGHDNRQDEGDAICKADGDNFYLAGNSLFWPPGPSIRPFVVKINAYGDTLWARSLILNGNHGGWAYALLPMWDGGCAVTGRSDPRYILHG